MSDTCEDGVYQGSEFGLLNEPTRQWVDETVRKRLAVYELIGGERVRMQTDIYLNDRDIDTGSDQ